MIKDNNNYNFIQKLVNQQFENLEYQVLKRIWDCDVIKDLTNYINDHFYRYDSKKSVGRLLFGVYENSKVFEEELKKFENSENLSSFLKFFCAMENTIFSTDMDGEISKDVNTFKVPNYMRDEDIDDYLSFVRKPCFDYGLRIIKINDREFIAYWDKVFNVTTINCEERDIFGFDGSDLNYDEYNKKLRKIMR